VLAAIAVVLAVLDVVLFVLPVQRSSSTAARGQVLAAAKADTALVISYNYQHVDADAAKAGATLTGAFAAEYQKSMNSIVKVQAPKLKAVVEGQIDSAGIEAVSGDGKQVTVIVFGQQKVTNSTLTQPRTDLIRLRVTMTLVGTMWKISQVSQI
jgi:Mce-associated membrane protein